MRSSGTGPAHSLPTINGGSKQMTGNPCCWGIRKMVGGGPCTEQQLGLEDSAAEGWLEAPGRQLLSGDRKGLHPRWSLRMSAQTSQGHGPGLRSWGGPFLAVQTPPQQPSGPAPSQWSPHSSCFLDLFPEAHLGPKPANVQLIPSHPAGPVRLGPSPSIKQTRGSSLSGSPHPPFFPGSPFY